MLYLPYCLGLGWMNVVILNILACTNPTKGKSVAGSCYCR